MRFNLSSIYSSILFVLLIAGCLCNAGAASYRSDIPITSFGSDPVYVEGHFDCSSTGGLFTAFSMDSGPLASVNSGEFDTTSDCFFQTAVFGSNTIIRIQPISTADLSSFLNNTGLTGFDRMEINSRGSAAEDNIWSNPVPEPASMMLVGSSLIALAGIGRKKLLKKAASFKGREASKL